MGEIKNTQFFKAIQEEKALIDEQRAIIIDLQKRVEALEKSLKAQNAGEK